MKYNYKILNFDPQQGLITIQFENYQPLGFYAPFINGAYLSGQVLDDYIQMLYIQAIPYENRLTLVQGLTGAENISSLVEPAPVYVEQNTTALVEDPAIVLSVEPIRSIYYINERPEAIITFDKPITMNTFVNIMLTIISSPCLYMPSQYDSIGGSVIGPYITTGINGETLEMYIGQTTAHYKGPIYPGGISYTQANISAKTILNQIDNQEYIISVPIQLISEYKPNN